MVPGPKWRGAERTTALSMFRWADAINPKYSRNDNLVKDLLKNPVSLIYGDSSIGQGKEAGGIASRCFHDWSYSFEPLGAITDRVIHNSLSDAGTILSDESGKAARNAIYNIQYVKPGVRFIRFITLENASLDLIKIVIAVVNRTTRYGARTAILGDNMQNTVVGIGFSKGDTAITSYSVMEEAWNSETYNPEKLVKEKMDAVYGDNFLEGAGLSKLIADAHLLVSNREELNTLSRQIISKMEQDWSGFWGNESK